MPIGLGPRFLIEAALLIALAVVAGVERFSTITIVVVMAAAWAALAAVECIAWFVVRSRRGAATIAIATAPSDEQAPEPEPAPEVVPAPVPEPQPGAADEPEPAREPAPEPQPIPSTPRVAVLAGAPGEPDAAEELQPQAPPIRPVGEPEAPMDTPADLTLDDAPASAAEPEAAEDEREPESLQPEPMQAAAAEPPPIALDAHRIHGPRRWNLWDLERLARERSGSDVARDEERSYVLMYLREFAGPDGLLPADFDSVVRESFGDVLGAAQS